MKLIVYILGCLLIFPCLTKAQEFEWAQKAREKGPSPAAKAAYEKAVAHQEAKRERERQEALKRQEQFNKFEEEQEANRAEYEAKQETLQKECGADYKHLKVGMQLSRVQKCVGEFDLRGQVKRKEGIVDYYTRDTAFLYVKNGRVVAWGE